VITACAGVSNAQNLTGGLIAVDAQQHSVILNVNGHSYTIKGLTDQEVSALQRLNKAASEISIMATQNSDGSYTIATGQNALTFKVISISITTGTPGTSSGTPVASGNFGNSGPNEPGSVSFTGTVQSVSSTGIVVSMPDSSTLSMIINGQTDLSDFHGTLPSVGQLIKVDASANTSDGSLIATKLKSADSSDSTVDYTGMTTSAVGADNVLQFRIGNRDFRFTIVPGTTELKGFSTPQSIGSNATVQVKVQFQGTNGIIQEVKSGNS